MVGSSGAVRRGDARGVSLPPPRLLPSAQARHVDGEPKAECGLRLPGVFASGCGESGAERSVPSPSPPLLRSVSPTSSSSTSRACFRWPSALAYASRSSACASPQRFVRIAQRVPFFPRPPARPGVPPEPPRQGISGLLLRSCRCSCLCLDLLAAASTFHEFARVLPRAAAASRRLLCARCCAARASTDSGVPPDTEEPGCSLYLSCNILDRLRLLVQAFEQPVADGPEGLMVDWDLNDHRHLECRGRHETFSESLGKAA